MTKKKFVNSKKNRSKLYWLYQWKFMNEETDEDLQRVRHLNKLHEVSKEDLNHMRETLNQKER